MSMKSLPLLFINLGGEMIYILDQRLRAQNIPKEKAKKVLHDIVGMMYNKRFMEELFKPQYLYSKKAMRTVFDRLAHASIMRLNAASMDKLYDLMMMAFKHQVLMSLTPPDILLITLNHIDTIRGFVGDSQPIREQVDSVFQLLIGAYGGLTSSDFYIIRANLLDFFQDMHIRVSIFLKCHSQISNGRFTQPLNADLPWGTEMPGTIRIYDALTTQPRKLNFPSGGEYRAPQRKGSLDTHGDRVTKLGCNMYEEDYTRNQSTIHSSKSVLTSADMDLSNLDPKAAAQIDLLARLIGSHDQSTQQFRLDLFDTDSEQHETETIKGSTHSEPSDNVIKINATKAENAELHRIMGELMVDDSTTTDKGDDLLDLLDIA